MILSRHGQERSGGQALTEFALVLPIIVLLLFALFDAGRGVIFYTELTNAARAGARVAMVNQSNDASCASVETFKCAASRITAMIKVPPTAIQDVTIAGTNCDLLAECSATVTLEYDYQFITPVIGDIIGPISLSASTTMPIERDYSSP